MDKIRGNRWVKMPELTKSLFFISSPPAKVFKRLLKTQQSKEKKKKKDKQNETGNSVK